jgi:phytanoyl-CoA hydroxylase
LDHPVGFPKPADSARVRRSLYEQQGFVLGQRLLDQPQLEELRADFDRIFARRDEPGIRQRPVEAGSTAYYCIYDLRDHSAAFAALVRDPRLVRMLSELTGLESFRVGVDQVQYKPPRVGGQNGWHRDMPSFPLIKPYTAITAWVALDDAIYTSGCMRMVPGSHHWGEARDIATDWGLHVPNVYHGNEVHTVSCPVPAGYVHFHNDLVWHYSPRNRSRHPRRAVAIHFINPDARHSADELSRFVDLPHGAPMSEVLPICVTSNDAPS